MVEPACPSPAYNTSSPAEITEKLLEQSFRTRASRACGPEHQAHLDSCHSADVSSVEIGDENCEVWVPLLLDSDHAKN
jgi:hypothetical protein